MAVELVVHVILSTVLLTNSIQHSLEYLYIRCAKPFVLFCSPVVANNLAHVKFSRTLYNLTTSLILSI